MLINSLLSYMTYTHWVKFTLDIEQLNVPKAVVWRMSSHIIEEPTSSTSKRTWRVVYRLKTAVVDPEDPWCRRC